MTALDIRSTLEHAGADLPASQNNGGQLPLVILHNNEGIEELAADLVRAELAGVITGPTQYPNYQGRRA